MGPACLEADGSPSPYRSMPRARRAFSDVADLVPESGLALNHCHYPDLDLNRTAALFTPSP